MMAHASKLIFLTVFLFFLLISSPVRGQISSSGSGIVSAAVPFLTISPDARAGGMGDLGVATAPDAMSMHWNPAKYGMIDRLCGLSFSYVPWLSRVTDDMGMAYLSGFYRLDKFQTFSSSLRFFSWGDIEFHTAEGMENGGASPFELAFDVGYSRKLSNYLSGAVAFRYIHSDLFSGVNNKEAGNAFAADFAFFYTRPVVLGSTQAMWNSGLNISNIGTKISYDKGGRKDFIPTNLRLGTSLDFLFRRNHQLMLALELNKLLVPTLTRKFEATPENQVVVNTRHSDQSVLSGMFKSFSDAPGGFSEEMKEISWALGASYKLYHSISTRLGYFYEHEDKGNRQYFTLGLGVSLKKELSLDFSYLVPTKTEDPMANTFHITLSLERD